MNFSLDGIITSLKNFWTKLSRPQKVLTVVAPLLLISTLVTLLLWANRPQYVPIFNNISPADAGAVTNKLKDLKVDYRLADGGSTISVPQKQAAEVRLQLASAGLPQGSKFSFDSLNQMRLGETDKDRRLRYILGLQNELETTLKTITGVQNARVHIVMPEPSLFIDKEQPSKVAVTLDLVPGHKLGDDQVRAIANLLAASVEGLQPENVTIVDTKGNDYSRVVANDRNPGQITGSQIQLQQSVEENLQKSVQTMLDKVFGSGKTIVRANATIDFDQVQQKKQTHSDGPKVSEQHTKEDTTNGSTTGGITGTQPNVPGAPTYPAVTGGNTSTSAKSSDVINYQVNTIQEDRIIGPGAIKRLSVSVMVDADSVPQTQVDQIKTIVASATGIVPNRGDQIEVAAFPFNKTNIQEEKRLLEEAVRKEQIYTYAQYGAGALLGLVLLLLLLRSRSKRKREEKSISLSGGLGPVPLAAAEELLLAQQQAEQEAQLKLAQKKTKTAEEIERQKVKEAVELYTQNNPDEVARLVKTWLAEDR